MQTRLPALQKQWFTKPAVLCWMGWAACELYQLASNGLRYASWVDAVKGLPLAEESVAQPSDQSQVMMDGAPEQGFVLVDSSSSLN